MNNIKLINDDCLKAMQEIEKNSIDLIITSPPYEDISGAGYGAGIKDVLFLKLYNDFLNKVFKEYQRILKNNGQIFFNIKSKTFNKKIRTPHWIEFLEGFNLFDFKSYIIWKYSGSFDSTKKRFHLDYEIIYHLSKGDNIYLNTENNIHDCLTSVWYIPHNIKKNERIHPTQMPEKLVERILTIASKKDDLILDSFSGSGTTGVMCKKMGRKYIGIEINPNHYKNSKDRINKTQIKLF